jgi:isopentenyl diphosphate isomerase/L-lactate dehydrogenase-like FMN-dependent dehydrogenase
LCKDQCVLTELLIDSGFRRGSDVAKALCLGAEAAFFGRPAMFGVAAAGAAQNRTSESGPSVHCMLAGELPPR